MITVLGLIYLTQATQATGFDYQAQKIENQIAELSIQKDNLEVENARLTAMQTVKSSTVAAKLSEPKTFEYAN
ncbi:hypothetical protein CR956_00420 [Candidatus Saccharibacteria bacterium]|nr:MAG: hypothetical protein CR956_00420 [Candidatus Saccharibacteria bacterium]